MCCDAHLIIWYSGSWNECDYISQTEYALLIRSWRNPLESRVAFIWICLVVCCRHEWYQSGCDKLCTLPDPRVENVQFRNISGFTNLWTIKNEILEGVFIIPADTLATILPKFVIDPISSSALPAPHRLSLYNLPTGCILERIWTDDRMICRSPIQNNGERIDMKHLAHSWL